MLEYFCKSRERRERERAGTREREIQHCRAVEMNDILLCAVGHRRTHVCVLNKKSEKQSRRNIHPKTDGTLRGASSFG